MKINKSMFVNESSFIESVKTESKIENSDITTLNSIKKIESFVAEEPLLGIDEKDFFRGVSADQRLDVNIDEFKMVLETLEDQVLISEFQQLKEITNIVVPILKERNVVELQKFDCDNLNHREFIFQGFGGIEEDNAFVFANNDEFIGKKIIDKTKGKETVVDPSRIRQMTPEQIEQMQATVQRFVALVEEFELRNLPLPLSVQAENEHLVEIKRQLEPKRVSILTPREVETKREFSKERVEKIRKHEAAQFQILEKVLAGGKLARSLQKKLKVISTEKQREKYQRDREEIIKHERIESDYVNGLKVKASQKAVEKLMEQIQDIALKENIEYSDEEFHVVQQLVKFDEELLSQPIVEIVTVICSALEDCLKKGVLKEKLLLDKFNLIKSRIA